MRKRWREANGGATCSGNVTSVRRRCRIKLFYWRDDGGVMRSTSSGSKRSSGAINWLPERADLATPEVA